MSAPNDGGPAFPNNDAHGCAFPGMTLRDWFAGQALTGILAGQLAQQLGRVKSIKFETMVQRMSDEIADAMLAARDGKEQP